MSGVALKYDLAAVRRIEDRIDALSGLDRRDLLEAAAGTVESQVRRRIEEDKTGPDGIAWPAWSERYAKTRHGGHKLLEGEGDLLGRIEAVVSDDDAEIGSNLIYAATHQAGDADRNIPARPYLGLSGDDESEVEQVVDNYLREVIR